MSLTKIFISLGILFAIAVAGFSLATKIASLEKDKAEAQATIKALTASVEAFSNSASNIQQQQARENEINRKLSSLNSTVKQLRDSVEKVRAYSATNPEACGRSISAAGELLGDCAERYSDVAGKAERLKSGVKALDTHIGILEGLAPLKPLEASNGNK